MWIELPITTVILINVLGIPAVHLLTSWAFIKLPHTLFQKIPLPPTTPTEQSIYKKILHIHRWKKHLPDAAPWFQGFAKKNLTSRNPAYLKRFITETKRAELCHYAQAILITLFTIWTPQPAHLIILTYAILSNLPCITLQRQTRQRLTKILSPNPRPKN